jgi:hypothetical protein
MTTLRFISPDRVDGPDGFTPAPGTRSFFGEGDKNSGGSDGQGASGGLPPGWWVEVQSSSTGP